MKSRAVAVLVAAVGVALALPASAQADTGIVGTYHNRDSASKSDVTCDYVPYAVGAHEFVEKLKQLTVRPPAMRAAVAGQQLVGWQFYVTRTRDDQTTNQTTSKVTYTSPEQLAYATKTKNASFSTKNVGVRLPRDADATDVDYWYIVSIEMHWYTGGSISGQATHQFTYYHHVFRNDPYVSNFTGPQTCTALWAEYVP